MKKEIYISVTHAPIVLNSVLELLEDPEHGAQILFTGVVRSQNLGKKVLAVSYDAFEPLTLKTFETICMEVKERWGTQFRLAVVHRVGRLEVGEASIAIGVSSPHRAEAYEASRYLIDEIKHRAPIWKKEHYEDGETEWLDGHTLCQSSHALERK